MDNILSTELVVNIRNDLPSISALHAHLDGLDLLNPLHLRPDWDMYFMVRRNYKESDQFSFELVPETRFPRLAQVKLYETTRRGYIGSR